MTITIGCTEVISVSASCGRHYNLTQFLFSPHCTLMYCTSWTVHVSFTQLYIQHRYNPVSLCFTNSTIPYTSSNLCLSCNLSSSLRSLHKPCLYFFKYVNYKDNYQTDSYNCSFWKYRFIIITSTIRSSRSSGKSEPIQFTQVQAGQNNNFI